MIRQAKIEDVAQILKLRMETWKIACREIVSEENIKNADYAELETKLRKNFQKNNFNDFIFIYKYDKSIIGFIWFRKIIFIITIGGK